MRIIGKKSRWLIAVLAAALTLGAGITSMASGSVKIRFENPSKSNWTEEITIPKVTINYSEESPEWSKEPEDWTPGKKVTATFTLSGTYARKDCSVYGGELISVNASDDETVIKASYVPVVKLASPESAGWSDANKTRASWKKVPYASKYQVRLYKGGEEWVKTITSTATSVDLIEYMKDGESYYYEVKAIPKDTKEEKYMKESDYVMSDDSVTQELGDTSGRWSQYQEGKKYRENDGSYMSNGWKMIVGKWYYFNQNGYAVTGWQAVDNKWYYFDKEACMLTGWQQVNGIWYYLNPNGDMATGWIQPEPGKWYYLNGDGSMVVNTVIDGVYTVDGSGLWIQ
jgi:glucan-binding YG repeat protein